MNNFAELENIINKKPARKRVVVAAAHDLHTLEGISEAFSKGMIDPVLIGIGKEIEEIISAHGLPLSGCEIIDAPDDTSASKKAALMVAEGKGDAIMKGKLQTADLLREVVSKELGLLTGEIMSHAGLFQIPAYHKTVILTDGGMVISPDADQKRKVLDNAVRVMHSLGTEEPKVACLCATEVENPKMQASVDAAQLKRQNAEGVIKGCVVEGPISFDLAFDRESAKVKGYESPVVGDVDILLMPDMTAGNIVAKTLMCLAGSQMAGIIVGAKAPIVLVSRGATAEEKYWSLVFAAAAAA